MIIFFKTFQMVKNGLNLDKVSSQNFEMYSKILKPLENFNSQSLVMLGLHSSYFHTMFLWMCLHQRMPWFHFDPFSFFGPSLSHEPKVKVMMNSQVLIMVVILQWIEQLWCSKIVLFDAYFHNVKRLNQ